MDEKDIYIHFEKLKESSVQITQKNQETIEFLLNKGYITKAKTQVHSISALLKGKSESFELDHYMFTELGNQTYSKLKKKYA
jgi:hypothetical protein